MNQENVLQLLSLFEEHSINVVVDGGWGVDALLGEQTRNHDDLDIAVQRKDIEALRKLLEGQGYSDVPRDDTTEYMFVLGDKQGKSVDVHVYEFDSLGNHVYGIEYPIESLNGDGQIGNHSVKCITPECVVRFHTGYQLGENDFHDVSRVCEKFNIPLPDEYRKFQN